MRKIISFFLVACAFSTNAQVDLGSPAAVSKGGAVTATIQNWDCIGLNPAGLGYEDNYNFSLGLANYYVNVQSKALKLGDLLKAASDPAKGFSQEQKNKYATAFSSEDGLNLQATSNWFMASVWFPKIGGIGFSIRDRISGHLTMNGNMADILFNGVNSKVYNDTNLLKQPISKLLDGTIVNYKHFREFNLAYGRKIFGTPDGVELFAGIGLKYLYGISDMDFRVNGNAITGRSAMNTEYSFNTESVPNYTFQPTDNLFNTVGNGIGYDFGITVKIKSNFSIAAAYTDGGSIKWNKNTLIAVDSVLPALDTSALGLQNFDPNLITGFIYNSMTSMVRIKEGEGYTTMLPAKLRIGVGYKIKDRLTISMDAITPLNDVDLTLDNGYYALGIEARLFKTTKVACGITGNEKYGYSVPFGFTIGSFGVTEFYLATSDLISLLDKAKSPQFSIAVGLFRFNWMNHTTKPPMLAE